MDDEKKEAMTEEAHVKKHGEKKEESHAEHHVEKHHEKKEHKPHEDHKEEPVKNDSIEKISAEPEKKTKKSSLIEEGKLELGVIAFTILFLFIVIFNQYQIASLNSDIDQKMIDAELAKQAARVELTVLSDETCTGCFNATALANSIKATVNVTSEKTLKFSDREAKELIAKYNIQSLPTIVLRGEIDKAHASLQSLSKQEDILYLANVPAPYFETATGLVRGNVVLTHIKDSSCAKCSSTASFGVQLKSAGVHIASEEIVESTSAKGKELIQKYSIKTIPAISMSADAKYYPIVAAAWPQLGDIASDGTYVLRTSNPPYINLTTGKVSGIVQITYLSDRTCAACYDPAIHGKIVMQTYGMAVENTTATDVNDKSGKDLIAKYAITAVPTVLITSDAKYYPSFAGVWAGVGSVESDGTFIFRNFGAFPGN